MKENMNVLMPGQVEGGGDGKSSGGGGGGGVRG